MSGVTRLNININDETSDYLRSQTAKEQITATELIRRAVSVYKFLEDARERGDEIQVVDRKGKTVVVTIL